MVERFDLWRNGFVELVVQPKNARCGSTVQDCLLRPPVMEVFKTSHYLPWLVGTSETRPNQLLMTQTQEVQPALKGFA